MEQKKQPTYYFPVHIQASTLCKLFTSKPSTSKKNVLGMEELFPCKKRLNKLRLFILEKRQLRGKKKCGRPQSHEWPREQFTDSLLIASFNTHSEGHQGRLADPSSKQTSSSSFICSRIS